MADAVGLIYETVAEPAAWDEAVRAVSAEVGGTASWLYRPGIAGPGALSGPSFVTLNGLSRAVVDGYLSYYHSVDVLSSEGIRRRRELAGRALRERDIVSEQVWLRSEVYNDLAVPNGVGQILTALLGPGTASQPAPFMSLFRASGAELFPDEAVRRYERLLPHLQRAVRLREAIAGQLASVPGWTAALLDQLPAGVLLLDAAGRVVHANAAARTILDARDGFCVRDGRPGAMARGTARHLDAVIAASLSAQPTGGELRVPRPSGAPDWLVSACPLPAASAGALGTAACRAWLYVAGPAVECAGAARRVGALFGPTQAEQRVAAGLLRDLSPKEIAEVHGVALATVRTQVQSLLGKLGVRRQAELVLLLARTEGLPGGVLHHQP